MKSVENREVKIRNSEFSDFNLYHLLSLMYIKVCVSIKLTTWLPFNTTNLILLGTLQVFDFEYLGINWEHYNTYRAIDILKVKRNLVMIFINDSSSSPYFKLSTILFHLLTNNH